MLVLVETMSPPNNKLQLSILLASVTLNSKSMLAGVDDAPLSGEMSEIVGAVVSSTPPGPV